MIYCTWRNCKHVAGPIRTNHCEKQMKNLLIGFAGVIVVAGIAGAVVALVGPSGGSDRTGSAVTLEKADWESYNYQSCGKARSKQLNVRFSLAGGNELAARLLINQQDEDNYYFVELTNQRTSIGKVENGLERGIGTTGDVGIEAGKAKNVLVKRRALELAVFVDDAPAALAFDDSFSGGEVRFGARAGSPKVESFTVQPVGEVYFADDFMKAATEDSDWRKAGGSWHVKTLQNPSLSSNAFLYIGSKTSTEAAMAAAGYWFWDNYSFQVACKPSGVKPVGVCVYYRGPDDYYLFRWGSRTSERGLAKKQLVRKSHGKETILAETDGGYTAGQWYELLLSVAGDEIFAYVDGNLIFKERDPLLCCGSIALYTEEHGPTHFDDVYVVSGRGFRDTFAEPCVGKWQELGGSWEIDEERGRLHASVPGTGRYVTGDAGWRDYRCSVDLVGWEKGKVGLSACYLDEENYYLMSLVRDKGKVELRALIDGKKRRLDRQDWDVPDDEEPLPLAIDVTGGLVRGYVGDRCLVQAQQDESLTRGRIGLAGEECDASFDNVRVTFDKPAEPVLTVNEVFSREQSMENWAASESDWISKREFLDGRQACSVYWHRADFPGDVTLEFRPDTGSDEAPTSPEAICLAVSAEGDSLYTGYTLKLTGGSEPALSLHRGSKLEEQSDVSWAAGGTLKLSKQGPFVVAYVDGRRALSYRDREALVGGRVAFATTRGRFDSSNIKVFSPNVYTYNFQKACDEWRAAGGVWEVTNRWQCDPRWSFFSGRSTRLAAIWNKRKFRGDVTLEFGGGIKMQRERGGRYQYASDINATMCGDGRDLTSGYSFLFGGWHNRKTQILKGTTVVAESSYKIPTHQNIHRRWFYVKAQKRGDHLSYWIDNRLILEYTDPEPLSGDQVALWTYNNGLMVSRVRISSESGKTRELPDPDRPEVAKCCYD